MSGRQREARKKQLLADRSKIRAQLAKIKVELDLIRLVEEIPGHVTMNEYFGKHHDELTAVEKSKLGDRLQKGADKGDWEQGWKTVATHNKARVARQPTYPPNVIKGELRDIRATER